MVATLQQIRNERADCRAIRMKQLTEEATKELSLVVQCLT